MVPSSWISTTIGETAELGSGSTPSRSKQGDYFDGGTIPWVKTGDLNNDLIQQTEESITEKALEESSCKIYPSGTLLVAMYGGFNQIGRTGLLGCDAAVNQALTAISLDRSLACPEYVQQWLNCRVSHWKRLAGSSRKDPNITKSEVAAFPLLLPPANEQRAIVCILSVWDRGIRQLSDLIAAKVHFKQGLMQQLLTGQRRFRKFVKSNERRDIAFGEIPAEWDAVPLREITEEMKRKNDRGVTHVLTASGQHGLVDQLDYFNRSVAGKSLEGYSLLFKGEFAYNRSLMKGYPFGAIKRLDAYDEGVVSVLYLCFRLNSEDVDSDWLAHLFESGLLNSQIRGIAKVGARAHGLLNVASSEFFDIVTPLPSKPEQKAIASVLDKADREIELLQKELIALKQQKKGLMQKLLTGQVRVTIPHPPDEPGAKPCRKN